MKNETQKRDESNLAFKDLDAIGSILEHDLLIDRLLQQINELEKDNPIKFETNFLDRDLARPYFANIVEKLKEVSAVIEDLRVNLLDLKKIS